MNTGKFKKKGKTMNKEQIKQLLHHREPYFMVSEVTSINETSIEVVKTFTEEDFFIKSHFPDTPVVPGATIL